MRTVLCMTAFTTGTCFARAGITPSGSMLVAVAMGGEPACVVCVPVAIRSGLTVVLWLTFLGLGLGC